MKNTSEWMTADELADHFKVPLATVYKWNHERTGPRAYKLGRHLRFRLQDVDRWAEERVVVVYPDRLDTQLPVHELDQHSARARRIVDEGVRGDQGRKGASS